MILSEKEAAFERYLDATVMFKCDVCEKCSRVALLCIFDLEKLIGKPSALKIYGHLVICLCGSSFKKNFYPELAILEADTNPVWQDGAQLREFFEIG